MSESFRVIHDSRLCPTCDSDIIATERNHELVLSGSCLFFTDNTGGVKAFDLNGVFDFEDASREKHEYYQGEIFAMSGASVKHNRIQSNTMGEFYLQLKGKGCQPYGSDLRIHIPENTLYTYPDITIFCGPPDLTDDHFDTAKNPYVIVEILSLSTKNYDRFSKFNLYRDIKSLNTYILIDSLTYLIELHTKNEDNTWQLQDLKSREEIAESFFLFRGSLLQTLALPSHRRLQLHYKV